MGSDKNPENSENKDKSLSSELFWALVKRKKIEKKYES